MTMQNDDDRTPPKPFRLNWNWSWAEKRLLTKAARYAGLPLKTWYESRQRSIIEQAEREVRNHEGDKTE